MDAIGEHMNIAERIEALTRSVELLSHMHQDREKRFQGYFDRLTAAMEKITENVRPPSHADRKAF